VPFMRGLAAPPACERRACGGVRLPGHTPLVNRRPKYSCVILPSVRVFERQRVGCEARLTLKGVLGIAVEHERSLLTAECLRNPILTAFAVNGKPHLSTPSGGRA
jgi:hypothetical protein